LKERVRSYFSKNPDREMIPKLVLNSDKIDFIVTQNPNEALVLERELIRKHKPKYNSRLKDDKSYPFISLTNEEYPRILYTRFQQRMINVGDHFLMQVQQKELFNY
jgi:excinuclease ABC subunit C